MTQALSAQCPDTVMAGTANISRPLARNQRRALMMLALAMDGRTETLMNARGFSPELIAELVRAGLASTQVGQIDMGQRTVNVARVRITHAGRQALAKSPPR